MNPQPVTIAIPKDHPHYELLRQLAYRLASAERDPKTGIVVKKFARPDADAELLRELRKAVPDLDRLLTDSGIAKRPALPLLSDPVSLGKLIQSVLKSAPLPGATKAKFANLAADMASGRRPPGPHDVKL